MPDLLAGPDPELQRAAALARDAGALLLKMGARGVQRKTTPDDLVTEADRAASALLLAGLAAAFPGDARLSEEEEGDLARLKQERLWSIDPIDGTRHFVDGHPEYAVSLGLCVRGEPALGVVYAPALNWGCAGGPGRGLWAMTDGGLRPLVRPGAHPPYRLLTSVSEQRRELHRYPLGGRPGGSVALKLARMAAGEGDATFSISPRSEWDLAAGHALLRAVGGELTRRDGRPVRYNRPAPHLEQGVAAGVGGALPWLHARLAELGVPRAHLGVTPGDGAWALLSDVERAWADRGVLSLRYRAPHPAGDGALLALVLTAGGRALERSGDPEHLDLLRRDLTRAGLLDPA